MIFGRFIVTQDFFFVLLNVGKDIGLYPLNSRSLRFSKSPFRTFLVNDITKLEKNRSNFLEE